MYNDEEVFRQKILTEIRNDSTKPVKMIHDEQVKLNSEIENSPEYHKISSELLKKRNRFSPKILRILQNMKIVCGVKRATIKILCDGTFKTASKPFRET